MITQKRNRVRCAKALGAAVVLDAGTSHLLRALAPLCEPHAHATTVLSDKLDTCAFKSRNKLFGRFSSAANCISNIVRL
jgi:hypothetical protein